MLKSKTIYLLVTLVMICLVSVISQAGAQTIYGYDDKKTSLSVFAAIDTKSDDTGYGISFSMRDENVTDISYVHFDSVDLFQTARLTERQLFGFPAYIGISAAYANDRSDDTDAPNGLMTGLQVILNLAKPTSGISVDIRASSLSESINPIKWITDPDVLWAGAGISYTF
ncbi:MAG: hypothetical protein ACYC27_13760 [Armatimonadota bacterium]